MTANSHDALAGMTFSDALGGAARVLTDAGVESPAREARLLLAHVLGASVEFVLSRADNGIEAATFERFGLCVARRRAREPLAQIIGKREFWSMGFGVGREVLTPRPESESVVESALAAIGAAGRRNRPLSLLDLGTGSGCLLIALLSELPYAQGLGIDKSEAALQRAIGNARTLGVLGRAQFLCADWAQPIAGKYDVIVSNPPYIASGEIPRLMPEVSRYEPRLALDGGNDGLDAYRVLLPLIDGILAPAGSFHVELGEGQGEAVAALAAASGLRVLAARRDLAGIERCLSIGRG